MKEHAPNFVAPKEVAERLSIHYRTVIRMIERGELRAFPLHKPTKDKNGREKVGRYLIDPESVEDLIRRRLQPVNGETEREARVRSLTSKLVALADVIDLEKVADLIEHAEHRRDDLDRRRNGDRPDGPGTERHA